MEHAKHSPSSLKYIEVCPGWINNPDTSDDARRGSSTDAILTAHVQGESYVIPDDIAPQVERGIAIFSEVVRSYPGTEWYAQHKCDTGILDCWGTADVAGINVQSGRGVILDWKTGWKTNAELQLSAYALGLAGENWLDEVDTIMVQLDQEREESRTYGLAELDGVRSRIETIIARREGATEKDYAPGTEQCQYCGRLDCGKREDVVYDILSAASEVIDADTKDAKTAARKAAMDLRPADVGRLIATYRPSLDLASQWMGALEARAMAILSAGADVPGLTIENGRKSRAWANAEDVPVALQSLGVAEEQIWKRELISPAQAEKIIPMPAKQAKAALDPFLVTRPGKPKLAIIEGYAFQADAAQVRLPDHEDKQKQFVCHDMKGAHVFPCYCEKECEKRDGCVDYQQSQNFLEA